VVTFVQTTIVDGGPLLPPKKEEREKKKKKGKSIQSGRGKQRPQQFFLWHHHHPYPCLDRHLGAQSERQEQGSERKKGKKKKSLIGGNLSSVVTSYHFFLDLFIATVVTQRKGGGKRKAFRGGGGEGPARSIMPFSSVNLSSRAKTFPRRGGKNSGKERRWGTRRSRPTRWFTLPSVSERRGQRGEGITAGRERTAIRLLEIGFNNHQGHLFTGKGGGEEKKGKKRYRPRGGCMAFVGRETLTKVKKGKGEKTFKEETPSQVV